MTLSEFKAALRAAPTVYAHMRGDTCIEVTRKHAIAWATKGGGLGSKVFVASTKAVFLADLEGSELTVLGRGKPGGDFTITPGHGTKLTAELGGEFVV